MNSPNHQSPIRYWLAAILLALLALPADAKAQELQPGKMIERVVCLSNNNYSYALYLPSNYDSKRHWPVIYGFDPAARGNLPVELFKEAAEKYGYIVAGSNNSRNGPGVPLSEIIKTLLEDTSARLRIDTARVYTTGFSGGARVAGMIAFSLQGQIAGVIACGAGFPSQTRPAKDLPFAFYGIAGSEDFNLIEVRQVVRSLEDLGATAHFTEFEGEHSWPPASFCTEAVEWMELQAMKAGRRSRKVRAIRTGSPRGSS